MADGDNKTPLTIQLILSKVLKILSDLVERIHSRFIFRAPPSLRTRDLVPFKTRSDNNQVELKHICNCIMQL